MFYKTLHRKLKIEKYEPTKKDTKTGGKVVPAQLKGVIRTEILLVC
jgi:hypothetical protein